MGYLLSHELFFNGCFCSGNVSALEGCAINEHLLSTSWGGKGPTAVLPSTQPDTFPEAFRIVYVGRRMRLDGKGGEGGKRRMTRRMRRRRERRRERRGGG